MLATAIVDKLHPRRHEMLALRSTCTTMRGAIDERLDSLLKMLTAQKAKRCLGIGHKDRHKDRSCCQDCTEDSTRESKLAAVLECWEPPHTRSQLFPLLFRCCCFCRKTVHLPNSYPTCQELTHIVIKDSLSTTIVEAHVFAHDDCLADRIAWVSLMPDGMTDVWVEHAERREQVIDGDWHKNTSGRWVWQDELKDVNWHESTGRRRSMMRKMRRMLKGKDSRDFLKLLPPCPEHTTDPSDPPLILIQMALHPHPCIPDHLVLSKLLQP